MDYGHVVMTVIAVAAVAVSAISLIQGRKLRRRQTSLLADSAKLSRLQRLFLRREEAERVFSWVDAYLSKAAQGCRIVVCNTGNVDVQEVNLRVEEHPGTESLLLVLEAQAKLPVKRMSPGDEVSLMILVSKNTGDIVKAILDWTDSQGGRCSREILLWTGIWNPVVAHRFAVEPLCLSQLVRISGPLRDAHLFNNAGRAWMQDASDKQIFHEGQSVRVVGPLAAHYTQQVGIVRSVSLKGGVHRYMVEFPDGISEIFFDFELRRTPTAAAT
jgi:hypothetical protein